MYSLQAACHVLEVERRGYRHQDLVPSLEASILALEYYYLSSYQRTSIVVGHFKQGYRRTSREEPIALENPLELGDILDLGPGSVVVLNCWRHETLLSWMGS
jgi:hypothetical protein